MRNIITIVIASISIAVSAIGIEAFNKIKSMKENNELIKWVEEKESNMNFLWVNLAFSILSILYAIYSIVFNGDL